MKYINQIFKVTLMSLVIAGTGVAYASDRAPEDWLKSDQGNGILYQLSRAHFNRDAREVGEILNVLPEENRTKIILFRGDFGFTWLHHITANDTGVFDKGVAVAREFLNRLPEEKKTEFVMAEDLSGGTALHYAIGNGNLAMMKFLLAEIPASKRLGAIKTAKGMLSRMPVFALAELLQADKPEIFDELIKYLQ